MLPDFQLSFTELADWYLNLASVKKLSSYPRIQIALANFKKVFGFTVAAGIRPEDLEGSSRQAFEPGACFDYAGRGSRGQQRHGV